MLRHNRKARVLKKPYTKLLYKALIKQPKAFTPWAVLFYEVVNLITVVNRITVVNSGL